MVMKEEKLEKEFNDSPTYVRCLLEACLDPLVTISTQGKIMDVNQATQDATGYTREHLIGRNFSAFFTDPQKAEKGYQKVLSQGQVRDYPLTIQHKNGKLTPVLYNATVYYNEKGIVQGIFALARDITERIKAEEALIKSERLYRSLFENLLDGWAHCKILYKNNQPVDFIYLEVNNAYEQVSKLKNVVGKKITELIPGIWASNPELIETYARVAKTGKPERFEIYLKSWDKYYNISAYSPEKDHFIAIFEDITESKKLEKEVRNLSWYNRNLTEANLDALITISPQGKIMDINKATQEVTGFTRLQLVGRDFSKYFTDPQKANEGYLKVLSEGQVRDYPLTIKHRNGKLTPVLYNATVYRNQEGIVQGVLADARDITQQKKLEEEKQLLATMASSTNDSVIILDLSGNIIAWNKGAEKMYGYSESQAVEMNICDLVPASAKEECLDRLRNIIADTAPKSFESKRLTKEGRIVDIWVSITRLTRDGKIYAVASTGRDITEHNRNTALLEALPKLIIMAQEEERARIAREIHDDFGQSLIALKIYITAKFTQIMNDYPDLKASKKIIPAYEKTKLDLSSIIDKARNLSHDLFPPSLQYIGLTTAIKKLIESMSHIKDLEIKFVHRNMDKFSLGAYEIFIYRIAQEGLTNILKHAQASRVEIKLLCNKHRFSLEIKDNGKGFEPKKMKNATGAGVILMRERAAMINGDLQLTSRSGKGIVLKLTLPMEVKDKNE